MITTELKWRIVCDEPDEEDEIRVKVEGKYVFISLRGQNNWLEAEHAIELADVLKLAAEGVCDD